MEEWVRDTRGSHTVRLGRTVAELGVQARLQAGQLFLAANDPSRAPSLPLHTQEWSEPGAGELQGPRV